MADVQLENGYVAIANRLLEAMIEAGFSERQMRVVLVLARLTYGWRTQSVQLTELELANYAGALTKSGARRAGGSFRSDVGDLLREGVIVRLEGPNRARFTWAINKDYGTWGRFSTTENRIESRWGKRPVSSKIDDQSVRERLAQNQAIERPEVRPPEQTEWPAIRPDSGPTAGHNVAPQRATSLPEVVENEEVARLESHREPLKASKATATTADEPSIEAKFCLGITTAANIAISKKWGEQADPLYYGKSTQLAADLVQMGVSLPMAQGSIRFQVERSKNVTAPKSIEYFRAGILQAAQSDEQRAIDSTAAPISTSSPSLQLAEAQIESTVKYLAETMTEREMLPKYESERERAAKLWADAPAHAGRLALITAASEKANSFLGPRWVARAIVAACAQAAEFPSFEVWLAARRKAQSVPRGTPESL